MIPFVSKYGFVPMGGSPSGKAARLLISRLERLRVSGCGSVPESLSSVAIELAERVAMFENRHFNDMRLVTRLYALLRERGFNEELWGWDCQSPSKVGFARYTEKNEVTSYCLAATGRDWYGRNEPDGEYFLNGAVLWCESAGCGMMLGTYGLMESARVARIGMTRWGDALALLSDVGRLELSYAPCFKKLSFAGYGEKEKWLRRVHDAMDVMEGGFEDFRDGFVEHAGKLVEGIGSEKE